MIPTRSFNTDTRAAAFSIEYALIFVIAIGILATVPPILATGVDTTQEETIQSEFDRIGGEIVSAVETAESNQNQHEAVEDQIGIDADSSVTIRITTPDRLSGVTYQIRADGSSIIIESSPASGADVRSTYQTDVDTDITAQGGTHGGDIAIDFNQSEDTIEIVQDPDSGANPASSRQSLISPIHP